MIRIINWINTWLGRAVSFLLLAMIATTAFEVVARYFFNRPTIWCMELNIYLLAVYCMLGAGFTMLRNGHVSVDIVYSRLSFRTQAVLSCLTYFLSFIFTAVILWYGWNVAFKAFKYGQTSGSVLDWPLFPTMVMVPVGALLLLLQGIVKLVGDLKTAWTGKPPEAAAPGGIFGHAKGK